MKRQLLLLAVLAAAACTPPDQHARAEGNWASCQGGAFPAGRVAACSAVIEDRAIPAERRAAALVQRGMLRAEAGQPGRAVADFGRALRLDNKNADAYVERGVVHQERGAFQIAVRDYDAALAIDPNFPAAVQRRQAALTGQVATYREQLDRLDQFLSRTPNDANALNGRCWLRATNNEDLDLALDDCNASLRIRPNDANTLDSRGFVHLRRGEWSAAMADYQSAIAIEPRSGHFLYGRAIAESRLGQTAQANADRDAALRLEPGIADEYSGYGVEL